MRRVRTCACARSWSRAGRWRKARTSMTGGGAAECVVCVRACVCVRVLCILSRLGSIRRGLACYSISYHALAVSAEAWHPILYLITSSQYLPRLGMLFYILSLLGSIRRRINLQNPCYEKLKLNKERHAGVRDYEVPCRRDWQGYSMACAQIRKKFLAKKFAKIKEYMPRRRY